MTKVAGIISYRFLPADSGGRKAIALFNRYFSRQVQLTCITTRNNGTDPLAGYTQEKLFDTAATRYANPLYFYQIRKIIREHHITHITIDHPYYGWMGVLLKKQAGVQLVIRSHNIEGQRFKTLGKWWWPMMAAYEKWVHRQADYNFFITDEDQQYAIQHFKLSPALCTTITYGVESPLPPAVAEKAAAAAQLRQQHQINSEEPILLFNGIFDYKPNAAALDLLVTRIYPLLVQTGQPFKLIICGKGIPAYITPTTYPQIITAGFVADIQLYLKGADLFLNPITDGGGIKTKLVEALAANASCISFANGAIGIPASITGNKLRVVADDDVQAFCAGISNSLATCHDTIPAAFFDRFYWENIAKKAADFINS
jgi:glycosyltransferase involved in cell wall biosynthesis